MTQAERSAETETGTATLPTLVGRLGDDIVTLLDSKFSLLKLEIRDDLAGYVRGGIALAAGALVLAVGFALLNVALAFAVVLLLKESTLAQPSKYALGFAVTGSVYVILGIVIVLAAKARLARRDLTPEITVEELEKDRKWLRRER